MLDKAFKGEQYYAYIIIEMLLLWLSCSAFYGRRFLWMILSRKCSNIQGPRLRFVTYYSSNCNSGCTVSLIKIVIPPALFSILLFSLAFSAFVKYAYITGARIIEYIALLRGPRVLLGATSREHGNGSWGTVFRNVS